MGSQHFFVSGHIAVEDAYRGTGIQAARAGSSASELLEQTFSLKITLKECDLILLEMPESKNSLALVAHTTAVLNMNDAHRLLSANLEIQVNCRFLFLFEYPDVIEVKQLEARQDLLDPRFSPVLFTVHNFLGCFITEFLFQLMRKHFQYFCYSSQCCGNSIKNTGIYWCIKDLQTVYSGTAL
ncbi:unnamed protein product [Gongylonema pulchrum]|uniref:Protein-tyrosine-phosphatase n=1 Tax=Gongylonema pulchrum TaxID=637853 RepID=A0A183DC73_9BILA|nr:unnamed protein product [Gongylonema pulchrum]